MDFIIFSYLNSKLSQQLNRHFFWTAESPQSILNGSYYRNVILKNYKANGNCRQLRQPIYEQIEENKMQCEEKEQVNFDNYKLCRENITKCWKM